MVHLTAERIEIIDCTEELQQLLDQVTLEDCFEGDLWPQLVCFGEMCGADGDIVPVSPMERSADAWNIGLNPLHGVDAEGCEQG